MPTTQQCVRVEPLSEAVEIYSRWEADPRLPAFNSTLLAAHGPDAHWALVDDAKRLSAHCSLWWTDTPPYPGHRLGLIGHYGAANPESGRAILSHALNELTSQGCTMAVGPMDGNTWRRYRLLTDRGDAPPFFLEPDNPDDWPEHFLNAEFSPLAEYHSALSEDLSAWESDVADDARRFADMGVYIRSVRLDDFEAELKALHAVSREGFQRNFLYSPIAEAEFLSLYRPIQPYVQPELVLIAEHEGRPVGFMFGIPDMAQAQRGGKIDTVILKTIARLPGEAYAGLGRVLFARCHQVAADLGYRRAIHALFHQDNASRRMSETHGRIFRRYTLFAKPLTP